MNPLLGQIGNIWKETSFAQKLIFLVLIAGFLIGSLGVKYCVREPEYGLLYGDLDQTEASEIVESLRDSNIPYKIKNKGRIVMVPSNMIYEVRMSLAKDNLPRGDVGFESFDKVKFGMSNLALNAKAHSDKDILLVKTKDDSDEKLYKLAEAIGATAWVVTTRQELRMIIDEFKSTSLMFIDTPGINHLNNVELLGLKEYIHNIPNLETHLVVSATTRFVDVINTVKNYAVIPVQRLLFTKVDETDIYGTLFSVAMATKIPLSYITDGQEMQRKVRPVTGSMIAEMILG